MSGCSIRYVVPKISRGEGYYFNQPLSTANDTAKLIKISLQNGCIQ